MYKTVDKCIVIEYMNERMNKLCIKKTRERKNQCI